MSVILSLSESLKAASMTYGALVVLWLDCPGRLHTTTLAPVSSLGKGDLILTLSLSIIFQIKGLISVYL